MSNSVNVWDPKDSVTEINNFSSVVRQRYIATGGQLVFNVNNFQYVPGTNSLLIYKNGVLLSPEIDVIETNGVTFTLTLAAVANDIILAVGYIGSIQAVTDPYYLGPKASEPTLDNQNILLSSLHEGYSYWNTTTKGAWIWNGASWQLPANINNVTVIGAGANTNISGLEASTSSNTDVFISSGYCVDDTASIDITLASDLIKDITLAWSEGTGNGAWDGQGLAPLASAGLLDVWIIRNPTSAAVDVLVTHLGNTPTMPSGYTQKRLISSIYHLLGSLSEFRQIGNKVTYSSSYDNDAASSLAISTKAVIDLIVPPNCTVFGYYNITTNLLTAPLSLLHTYENSPAVGIWPVLEYIDSAIVASGSSQKQFQSEIDSSGNLYVATINGGTGTVSSLIFYSTGYTVPKRDNP